MRHSILTIFLAALAGHAVAGWTVTSDANGQAEYVDKDTIRRSGNTAKMWTLRDYAQSPSIPYADKHLSQVILYEFECADQRMRTLQWITYKAQMGQGAQSASSDTPAEWRYAVPGSLGETKLKIACMTK